MGATESDTPWEVGLSELSILVKGSYLRWIKDIFKRWSGTVIKKFYDSSLVVYDVCIK